MSLVNTLRAMRSRPSQKAAGFVLLYAPPGEHPVTVGRLHFDGSLWTFWYDDEYKQRSDLRPIEGFDHVEKVYRSSVLFPFFAVRIPDPERNDVKRRLEAAAPPASPSMSGAMRTVSDLQQAEQASLTM
jgi:hypothetical protein